MYADLIDRGYAALRRGDAEAALGIFQRAIEHSPELPQAQFGIAMVHIEQGSREGAFRALEAALAVNPEYAPARAYLGLEYLQRYDVDAAQRELDQAMHDAPTNLLVHIKYAEFYYRLGFYDRAISLLEKGLKEPHGANEHIVAMARQLLTQTRQKNKGTIIREPPDPRRWLQLFTRLSKGKQSQVPGHT